MGRILKALFVLLAIGCVALLGYAYGLFGPLEPQRAETRVPVQLNDAN